MESPRAEQFLPVMDASINVLAQAVHHGEMPPPETEGRVANTWVLYDRLFGDEALGRAARLAGLEDDEAAAQLQEGAWDPFSDELLAQSMGEDPSEFDKILANYT